MDKHCMIVLGGAYGAPSTVRVACCTSDRCFLKNPPVEESRFLWFSRYTNCTRCHLLPLYIYIYYNIYIYMYIYIIIHIYINISIYLYIYIMYCIILYIYYNINILLYIYYNINILLYHIIYIIYFYYI